MQVMMHVWGGGVAVPKTKFGVGALMGAMLSIRAAEGHTPTVYAMADLMSVGTKSGTLIAGSVKTSWVNVDPASNEWIKDCNFFDGKSVEMGIHGTVTGEGFVDMSLSTISEDGIKTDLLKRFNIEATGGQLAGTQVTGELKLASHSCALEYADHRRAS
ncbi:MAG: hypothetical protein KTR20_11530 [Cellvibrionaceae bacterium]|nr:hypothetical protein [Cellvibrionaceae bacterium]